MNDLIVIAGGGGFIGGHLAKYFLERGRDVRAVDKKPLHKWEQVHEDADNRSLDLSNELDCQQAVIGAREVYDLAAEMGGMGFIARNRIACLRNILINANLIEAAYHARVERYFFSSSACVYNTDLQASPDVSPLKESDAYPARCERGYGWEKLFSEMFLQEYYAERRMKTFIARFHNVYGPHGTYEGGREKVIAALMRKIIESIQGGIPEIEIWGDGTQQRSFTYIDDCVYGIDRIVHCDELVATPVNLGTTEMISINDLLTMIEEIAGVKLQRTYDLSKPQGVAGRGSDNTFIRRVLSWEPGYPLRAGLEKTYRWIEKEMTKGG